MCTVLADEHPGPTIIVCHALSQILAASSAFFFALALVRDSDSIASAMFAHPGTIDAIQPLPATFSLFFFSLAVLRLTSDV
jgi:hypothetical protein